MSFDPERFKTIVRRLSVWDWILWFGIGGWSLFTSISERNYSLGFIAVSLLSAGCFQLLAHRWAWHVGLAAFLLILSFNLFLGFERGFPIWRIVMLLCILWGVWDHYRDRPRFLALTREASGLGGDENGEDDDGPRHSLVLLLREPLYLDSAILGQIASRAYGLSFNDRDDSECFIIGGDNTPYMMGMEGAMFLVHHWPRPYFDDPEAVANDFRELRRAAAVRQHRAWFSVDFLPASKDLPDEKIHDLIGRMLAEIAATDADVLAVCHPSTRRLVPWEPGFREKLAGGEPFSVFDSDQVPVVRVDSDSPAMAAAVAEARRRWPEFLAAYQSTAEKDRFAVKAPVTEGGETEFIWINVKAIADDQIHGFLANDPVALGDLKLGSFVSVAVSDLNDWVCPDPSAPDRPLGLFTVKAVHQTKPR